MYYVKIVLCLYCIVLCVRIASYFERSSAPRIVIHRNELSFESLINVISKVAPRINRHIL